MANRYDAFISYSRAADGDLAPKLQTGLQRLAKPWSKRRALEVFRDETGLAVTPDLWASITDALDDSRWFVLLASPQAATSRWVDQEIERWLENDPDGAGRILPVLTSGRLMWDLEAGDWSSDSDAAPESLRGVYAHEPRYIDMTWVDDTSSLDLEHTRFRQTVAEIAAPMHGLSQDDLIGEDVHRHRVATRIRRIAVAALVLITTTAVIAAVAALRAEDRAQRNAAEATVREYAALSASLLDDDPETATLYAVEAVVGPDGSPVDPTGRPVAERALRDALNQLLTADTHPVGVPIDLAATSIAVSPDGTRLAALDADGSVSIWDPETGERRADLPLATVAAPTDDWNVFGPFPELAFSPDGERLLLSWSGAGSEPLAPTVIEVVDGVVTSLDAVDIASWLPDGSIVAVGGRRDTVLRWTETDQPPETIARVELDDTTVSDDSFASEPEGINAITTTASGAVAVWTPDDRLLLVNPNDPGAPILERDLSGLRQAAVQTVWAPDPTADAIHVFLRTQPESSEGNRPNFWIERIEPADDVPAREPITAEPVAAGALAVSPDGAFVATIDGERQQGLSGAQSGILETGRFVEVTSVVAQSGRETQIRLPTNDATDVTWLPDGRVLAIASGSGIEYRRVDLDPFKRGAAGITVSGDGDRVATWDDEASRLTVDDIADDGPIMIFSAGSIEGDGADPSPGAGVVAFGVDGATVLYTDISRPPEADTADLGEAELVDAGAARNSPIATTSDGRLLVDGAGRIVEVSTGEGVRELDVGSSVLDLRWTDDDTTVVALGLDGTITSFDAATGEATTIASGLRSVSSFDVAGNGTTVVVGDDRGRLTVIDRATGETDRRIAAHRDPVTSIDVDDEASTVVSAGGEIAIHALDSGDEIWSSDSVPAIADAGWWLVAHLGDGSIVAANRERVVELHEPDLALACASVDPMAVTRFETVLGAPSSCSALNGASDPRAEPRPYPAAESAPMVTTPSSPLVFPPPGDEQEELATTTGALLDETLGFVARPLLDPETIRQTCPSFQDRNELPFRAGDRGVVVSAIQSLLRLAADDPNDPSLPAVDGCLGSHTNRYVQLFQIRESLEPTGVVDRATWDALLSG